VPFLFVGRVGDDAEITHSPAGKDKTSGLQWGRVGDDAETWLIPR